MSQGKQDASHGDGEHASSSVFLTSLRARAKTEGVDVQRLLDEGRSRARESVAQLTEDCLYPDEVEQLVNSENLAFSDGRLLAKSNATPTKAESEALAHVDECDFCRPLLRLMRPRILERQQFLEAVREETARRENAKAGKVDEIRTAANGLAGLRAYIPVALPIALAIFALSQSAAEASTPLGQALWASSPLVVTVGAIAGGAGWVATSVRRVGGSLASTQTAFADRGRTAMHASLSAAFFMVVVGLVAAYGTDRAVVAAQRTMVESAVLHFSDAGQANGPSLPGRDSCSPVGLDAGKGGVVQVCRAVETMPVPGAVVGNLNDASADIYWETRGKRLRSLQLIKARVAESSDGSRSLLLASGDSLPMTAEGQKRYAVGEAVVAFPGRVPSRVVEGLHVDMAAAKYPLMSAEAVLKLAK